MKIGLFTGDIYAPQTLEVLTADAARARAAGFSSFWTVNTFGHDALTALTAVGARVPDIELGTNIVPTYPRHPLALAQQAISVQAAVDARLVLGLGPSHKPVVEGMFGLDYSRPRHHSEEYLSVLNALLAGERVDHRGDQIHAVGGLGNPDRQPLPIIWAALGPKMLEMAGRLTDGVTTWMVGPEMMRDDVVPISSNAAESVGRPAPRIVAGMPVCVTDDETAARQAVGETFAMYGQLVNYQRVFAREGVTGPAEAAIVGNAESVTEQLTRYAESGATDFAATVFGRTADEVDATWDVLEAFVGT